MDWWALISGILGPILAKCFSQFSSEDPQDYLRANYDAASGRMNRDVVLDGMNGTRKAIRQTIRGLSARDRRNFPRYTRDEIYAMTERKYIEAMNAPREEVLAAFATAASMSDSGDD